ncbi:protein takeout-like [Daktulosphaira vitifoliae]|uniref:protein takeout-like n=1 Tax=Daktulosphaira vitifoliae TaxID=58002 RepID=UPI0021AA06A4|nr:protein takeout-like [Daktulosphaira vitifoliae]
MAKSLLVYNVLFCVLINFAIAAPPSTKKLVFNLCKKSDPNFDQCFKNSLQSVIPDLDKGYSKLRIPPLEPFQFPSLEIAEGKGSNKAVSIDLKMKDVKIHGISSIFIDSLKVDLDNYKLTAKVSFKKPIEIISQYTINGKILVLPIVGTGPCKIVLKEPRLELNDLTATPYEKHGKTFIKFPKINLKIVDIKYLTINFENLFNGDKQLGNNMNKVLNENWPVLLEELKSAFEEAIGAIIQDVLNKTLQTVPYADIAIQ